ncbi:Uncharacterised protein [Mycobacteroides abscessus subsp. abscessus]|nr:Uncharacterised protein [Mycobacteroides abscessus subsp. abscessus]
MMSRTITSKASLVACHSPSIPSLTVTTMNPSALRPAVTVSASSGSSSTSSTRTVHLPGVAYGCVQSYSPGCAAPDAGADPPTEMAALSWARS